MSGRHGNHGPAPGDDAGATRHPLGGPPLARHPASLPGEALPGRWAAAAGAPPGADPAGVRPDTVTPLFDGHVIDLTLEMWGPNEREIVGHPGAVAVLPVTAQGEVVFVRQLREATRRRLLEIPAGGLKAGEDPLAAGHRELTEETGLGGGAWTHAHTFWTTPGFCRELMWLYWAEGVEPGERWTEPDPDEDIEVVKVPLADVPALLPEIGDLKTLGALLLYLRSRAAG